MKEGLSFVASHELSRETPVAAGASSAARSLKVAAKVGAGCPSFGGQRTVASSRKRKNSEQSRHLSLSIEAPSFGSTSLLQLRGAWRILAAPILMLQPRHLSGSLRIQRWYASPSEFKARLPLQERGLTLPSSGLAFGQPLKSNVRPLRTLP